MKKRILLFFAASGLALVTLTSGQHGAGAESGYNCTGSETALGNITGCSASGCHGTTATTGITIAVELDSAGVPTTHYKNGKTYTVKITGTNTTSNTLPGFGFQVSCIKGTTSLATPVNAGTWVTTGLPSGVRHTAPSSYYVCDMIEHSTPLSATTLGGATGATYVVQFQWTAPAAGTGPVSFWVALNAVNNSGTVLGDYWNTTKQIINEWPQYLSVAETPAAFSLKAYPNPVQGNLNIVLDNANAGIYSLQAFDLNGRLVSSENTEISGNQPVSVNTAGWNPGIYSIVAEKDGVRKVIPVVKQ